MPAKLVKSATSLALGIVAMMLASTPSGQTQPTGAGVLERERVNAAHRRAVDLSTAVSAAVLARGLRW